MVDGSWLMAQGSLAGAPGPRRGVGGAWPGSREPCAMSHESSTVDDRLINELFDYLL